VRYLTVAETCHELEQASSRRYWPGCWRRLRPGSWCPCQGWSHRSARDWISLGRETRRPRWPLRSAPTPRRSPPWCGIPALGQAAERLMALPVSGECTQAPSPEVVGVSANAARDHHRQGGQVRRAAS